MNVYRQARVDLVGTDAYLPDDDDFFKFPMTATVFFNGSAGVLNRVRRGEGGRSEDERIDRIFEATLTENSDGTVTIAGRSEYLDSMGLMPEDQRVTISVKGAEKCKDC